MQTLGRGHGPQNAIWTILVTPLPGNSRFSGSGRSRSHQPKYSEGLIFKHFYKVLPIGRWVIADLKQKQIMNLKKKHAKSGVVILHYTMFYLLRDFNIVWFWEQPGNRTRGFAERNCSPALHQPKNCFYCHYLFTEARILTRHQVTRFSNAVIGNLQGKHTKSVIDPDPGRQFFKNTIGVK